MRYLFLILLLASCKCPKQAVGHGVQDESDVLTLTFVLADSYGGSEAENLQVFRSEGGLQKFFAGVNKTRKPGLPVPEIDFSKNIVLVYSAGQTPQGTGPELISHGEKEGRILLEAKKEEGQNISASAALTQPFAIYTIPRTEKELVLQRRPKP